MYMHQCTVCTACLVLYLTMMDMQINNPTSFQIEHIALAWVNSSLSTFVDQLSGITYSLLYGLLSCHEAL